jgi:general secretion pathway protein F
MATYRYTAFTAAGRRVEGSLAGASEQAVLAELEARQLTPVEVSETTDDKRIGFGRRISRRKLAEAYGQVADLLRAGVPLLRSLRLIGSQKSRGRLADVFRDLGESVEKGSDLASAMESHPGVFPSVHVAMVRAGEKGGFLEQVLARLSLMVTRQAELRSKVIGSLIYPSILVSIGLILGVVIFGVFVPKFRTMFAQLGDNVPFITKAVFLVSDLLTRYGLVTAIALGALVFLTWRALRNPLVRRGIELRALAVPVVGTIVRGYATARFCGLLGAMLANGVPLLTALGIARNGAGNVLLEQAVDEAAKAVRAGEHLAQPLARSGLFESDIIEMIAVGESANNLDEVLTRLADTIEARLERNLSIAVRLIEPLMLLLLACVVGLVAGALLLPMSQMTSTL